MQYVVDRDSLKMNEADKITHKFWFLGMIVKFIVKGSLFYSTSTSILGPLL